MEGKETERMAPRKKDSMEPWQFGRLAKVTSAYDESRGKGEKHSVAVRHAVNTVQRCNPETPISETGVKRILSTDRPRGSGTILRFEHSRSSMNYGRRKQNIVFVLLGTGFLKNAI